MSLHKLTAGSGYDYLTRQVAALDATEKGHTGLASYYTERGETPGVWIGSGVGGIDGLTAGDPAMQRGVLDLRSSIASLADENWWCRPVTSTHTGAGEPVAGVWRGSRVSLDCCYEHAGLCPGRGPSGPVPGGDGRLPG